LKKTRRGKKEGVFACGLNWANPAANPPSNPPKRKREMDGGKKGTREDTFSWREQIKGRGVLILSFFPAEKQHGFSFLEK